MEAIAQDPLLTFLVLVLLPLGLLLVILWLIVPFSVFGTKSRLNKMIQRLETISKQQDQIIRLIRKLIQETQVSKEQSAVYPEQQRKDSPK